MQSDRGSEGQRYTDSEVQMDKGYHKLLVWKKARELVKAIYQITEAFPKSEVFGLTSQLRRAAISVVLNIVEGDRRTSRREFLRFLDVADGSLVEIEACFEIALDLSCVSKQTFTDIEEKRREVAIMLSAFQKSIRKSL